MIALICLPSGPTNTAMAPVAAGFPLTVTLPVTLALGSPPQPAASSSGASRAARKRGVRRLRRRRGGRVTGFTVDIPVGEKVAAVGTAQRPPDRRTTGFHGYSSECTQEGSGLGRLSHGPEPAPA